MTNALTELIDSQIETDQMFRVQAKFWAAANWPMSPHQDDKFAGLFLPVLQAALPQKGSLLILDYGCGPGRLWQWLKPLASEYVGVDPVEEFLSVFKANSPEAQLYQIGSEKTGLPDSFFDLVVAWGILCHVSITQARLILEELHRVLAPAGRVIVSFIEPGYSLTSAFCNWVNHTRADVLDLAAQAGLLLVSEAKVPERDDAAQTIFILRRRTHEDKSPGQEIPI